MEYYSQWTSSGLKPGGWAALAKSRPFCEIHGSLQEQRLIFTCCLLFTLYNQLQLVSWWVYFEGFACCWGARELTMSNSSSLDSFTMRLCGWEPSFRLLPRNSFYHTFGGAWSLCTTINMCPTESGSDGNSDNLNLWSDRKETEHPSSWHMQGHGANLGKGTRTKIQISCLAGPMCFINISMRLIHS